MLQDDMFCEKLGNISGQIQSEPMTGVGSINGSHRSHKHRTFRHYRQIALQGARLSTTCMGR